MNTKSKLCFSGAMLALMMIATHGSAQSSPAAGSPGTPARICILLGILGVAQPPDCDDTAAEPTADPTSPQLPAADACPGHPGVVPRPGFSEMVFDTEREVFVVTTPQTVFAPSSSEDKLPTNLCPTVYENARSMSQAEIPNTLPSTPDNPYNLHPVPRLSSIDPRSPSDDLRTVIEALDAAVAAGELPAASDLQLGLDVLEGNPIDRAYSGMPLLHYNGPNKVKKVEPIFDEQGTKIGGRVELHQVWFDGRIMGDTAFLDPSDVQDVPWTMVVHADTLNNGHEDFAPFQMYFDDPVETGMPPKPHIGMDMTFFPMEDGTRTTFEMKMAPGRFFNLTYYWGWRLHPPRVQVTENALKRAGMGENDRSLVEWEQVVFGADPMGSEANKLAAIAMIGDLAPAKRMWNMLREFRDAPNLVDEAAVDAFRDAFFDWKDRLKLPSGIEYDDDYDMNLVYLNNTLYGKARDVQDGWEQTIDFDGPGDIVRVKVLNGDYFPHAYQFVDFGGNRGWENTFHSTVEEGGAGPWFTFGRTHWWPMLRPAPMVPPATPPSDGAQAMSIDSVLQWSMVPDQTTAASGAKARSKPAYSMSPEWLDFSESPSVLTEFQQTENINGSTLGVLPLEFHMNHIPSKRLKMYQFDPLHHDVAVWSVH
ncbi:MAG: hypothetical protein RQ741_03650 [Wenzhouxiangellaceae bacterium]|nr:hypothetical protein [Wenzhouxiangellaceae bacterium]